VSPALRFQRTRPELAEIPNFDAAQYLGEKGLRTLDRLSKLLLSRRAWRFMMLVSNETVPG